MKVFMVKRVPRLKAGLTVAVLTLTAGAVVGCEADVGAQANDVIDNNAAALKLPKPKPNQMEFVALQTIFTQIAQELLDVAEKTDDRENSEAAFLVGGLIKQGESLYNDNPYFSFAAEDDERLNDAVKSEQESVEQKRALGISAQPMQMFTQRPPFALSATNSVKAGGNYSLIRMRTIELQISNQGIVRAPALVFVNNDNFKTDSPAKASTANDGSFDFSPPSVGNVITLANYSDKTIQLDADTTTCELFLPTRADDNLSKEQQANFGRILEAPVTIPSFRPADQRCSNGLRYGALNLRIISPKAWGQIGGNSVKDRMSKQTRYVSAMTEGDAVVWKKVKLSAPESKESFFYVVGVENKKYRTFDILRKFWSDHYDLPCRCPALILSRVSKRIPQRQLPEQPHVAPAEAHGHVV